MHNSKRFVMYLRRINTIDLTYEINDKNTLKNQLDRIKSWSWKVCKGGAKHLVISDERVSKKGYPFQLF